MTRTYKTIRRLRSRHSTRLLCRALNVSRSAFYAWLRRKPGKRDIQDKSIRRAIWASHTAAPCYGLDNIHADVREQMVCGRNRVRRLMKQMGVRSKRKRRYKATTNSHHPYPVAPHLLRRVKPTAPDQVWVSDITYIPTEEGWLYLATVKDRFTREIVGYSTGDRLASQVALDALENALRHRNPPKGLIHHSDRGVQYCCEAYQAMLTIHGLRCSMSRKGNPYDNAVAENFFSCLKCEMVHLQRFSSRHDAELAIFCYIEGFYNRRRRHSALGRIAPALFRDQWEGQHGKNKTPLAV